VQPYFFSGWVDSWRKVAKGDCPKRGRSQRCFQFFYGDLGKRNDDFMAFWLAKMVIKWELNKNMVIQRDETC
jgi:hypothetical protein